MAYEPKPNTGTLGKARERKTERHPEYTGKATIGGVDYWIGAWVKESAQGKFFSLSFTPKDAKPEPKPEPKPAGKPGDRFGDFESDIPFDRIRSEYSVS